MGSFERRALHFFNDLLKASIDYLEVLWFVILVLPRSYSSCKLCRAAFYTAGNITLITRRPDRTKYKSIQRSGWLDLANYRNIICEGFNNSMKHSEL